MRPEKGAHVEPHLVPPIGEGPPDGTGPPYEAAARHAVGALFVPAAQPYLEETRPATGRGRLGLTAWQPGVTGDTVLATCVSAIG